VVDIAREFAAVFGVGIGVGLAEHRFGWGLAAGFSVTVLALPCGTSSQWIRRDLGCDRIAFQKAKNWATSATARRLCPITPGRGRYAARGSILQSETLRLGRRLEPHAKQVSPFRRLSGSRDAKFPIARLDLSIPSDVDQAIGPSPPRNLSNWAANSATFRRNHSTSIAACSISSFIL